MPTTTDPEKAEEFVERRKPRYTPNDVDPDADTDELEQIPVEELNERAERERRRGGVGE